MLFAEAAIDLHKDSNSICAKCSSWCFNLAISYICLTCTCPATSCPGLPAPFLSPAHFNRNQEVGGDFSTKVKLLFENAAMVNPVTYRWKGIEVRFEAGMGMGMEWAYELTLEDKITISFWGWVGGYIQNLPDNTTGQGISFSNVLVRSLNCLQKSAASSCNLRSSP